MKFYLIMKNAKHMTVMDMLPLSSKVGGLVLVVDLRVWKLFRYFEDFFGDIGGGGQGRNRGRQEQRGEDLNMR